ncbi:MAG: dihydrofolate reductase [Opitutae bacterium]|nr:dihydrofolate reductase [Opitutae bacterium]
MPKPLNLVVACAENRVMGRAGRLPWRIPEDLAWFHEHTRGQTVVLGRICYETWPRVDLDGRQPIVLTSRPEIARPGTRVAHSVPEALAIAETLPGEILVCGGQRIFEETLPLATRLYLTLVHAEVPGDVYFPEWRHLPWREISRRESRDASYRYTFFVLER